MRIRRPTKRQTIVGGTGLLLVVLLLYLAAFPAVEYYAFHIYTPPYSDLTPAKRAETKARYRAWRTERIHLPPEALAPQPYSAEMQAAARTFDDAWRKNKARADKLLSASTKGPNDDVHLLPTCGPELETLAPLIEAFSAVVRRPDYSYGAFASSWNYGSWLLDNSDYIDYSPLPEPAPSGLSMQWCTRLLRLKAIEETRAGRMEEALHDTETLLLTARTDAYDVLLNSFYAVSICVRGTETENEVLRRCEDPALLRHARAAQDALVGRFGFFSDRRVLVDGFERVGILREFRRRGVDVDYQDRTGFALGRLYLQAEAKFLETKVLPTMQNDPASVQGMADFIATLRADACLFGAWPRGFGGLVNWVSGPPRAPMTFWRDSNPVEEGAARADNVLTQFDLLRLTTARHLYTIEKGKAPDTVGDLVPGYLFEQPLDRFAKEMQPIREIDGVYYSVGPDGQDDRSEIVYDPSNGTQSRGDIVLRTLDWTTK